MSQTMEKKSAGLEKEIWKLGGLGIQRQLTDAVA